MKISRKIINFKVLKKFSMVYNALKISKLFDFIKTFVMKVNFKVRKKFKITIHFEIEFYYYYYFLAIGNYRNDIYSDDTNNFIH
jgi:hypothetical protein